MPVMYIRTNENCQYRHTAADKCCYYRYTRANKFQYKFYWESDFTEAMVVFGAVVGGGRGSEKKKNMQGQAA